ncbi:serine hydrolase [bacterium]|nr:serine hydrolase [bacterium]
MPKALRYDYESRYYNGTANYDRICYTNNISYINQKKVQHQAKHQKIVKRNQIIQRTVSVIFMLLLAFTVLPMNFNRVSKHLFNPTPHKNIKTDYHHMLFPTANYLSNHWFMGMRSFEHAKLKKPEMETLIEGTELTDLENSLKNLALEFPDVHPSVYVWDYQTGDYAELNANEIFPTASIIKLPVLVELFRSIEKGQLNLNDKMYLTEYYRTEGSGSLQFKAENSQYTIDNLARIMITESDNSATNMLMARLGSMTDINSALRQWGIKNTYVQTWLPDLDGTNHSTARDMAQILYNIDNPKFLSTASREKIFDYMGHVHNNRLIAAGLPEGVEFLHKTGDIGKMLGDAGIVYTPNGKRYIVVIFAKRPHNSPAGKEFIVRASEIIYNSMVY